jgi:hypothetical protein
MRSPAGRKAIGIGFLCQTFFFPKESLLTCGRRPLISLILRLFLRANPTSFSSIFLPSFVGKAHPCFLSSYPSFGRSPQNLILLFFYPQARPAPSSLFLILILYHAFFRSCLSVF